MLLALAQAGRAHAPAKEAVPLPLYVVANWELAVLEGMQCGGGADTLLLTAFLILIWSALRFSDGQRVSVQNMCVEDGMLRGHYWRTKTSKSGILGVLMSWHLRRLGTRSGLAGVHASGRFANSRSVGIFALGCTLSQCL